MNNSRLLAVLKEARKIVRGRHSTIPYGPMSLIEEMDAVINVLADTAEAAEGEQGRELFLRRWYDEIVGQIPNDDDHELRFEGFKQSVMVKSLLKVLAAERTAKIEPQPITPEMVERCLRYDRNVNGDFCTCQRGAMAEYIEYDGNIECEFCGKVVPEEKAYKYEPHVYCSYTCFGHDVGF